MTEPWVPSVFFFFFFDKIYGDLYFSSMNLFKSIHKYIYNIRESGRKLGAQSAWKFKSIYWVTRINSRHKAVQRVRGVVQEQLSKSGIL